MKDAATLSELTAARGTPRFAPDLDAAVVPVDSCHPHPENPRRGDVGAIADSLARFGQVKPILTLPDGTIVAGHHVYYAARHLGWDRVAVVRVDMDEAKARAYLLADNRLSELGGYDPEALGALLSDVASDTGLDGTGYRDEDVKRFLSDIEDVGGPGGGPGDLDGGGGRDGSTQVACPVCGTPVEDEA